MEDQNSYFNYKLNPQPPNQGNGNDQNQAVDQENRREGSGGNNPRRDPTTMIDNTHPNNRGAPQSVIVNPPADSNFVIKPQLMHMARQEDFRGNSLDYPHIHLLNFEKLRGIINVEEEQIEGAMLNLFLFSL